MEARTGQVAFANSPCLQLLSDRQHIQVVSGRFTFVAAVVADRFSALLDRLLSDELESATMIEQDDSGANFLAVTIRNSQGFFRDALNRSLGAGSDRAEFVIVEFSSNRDQSDWLAMRAFGRTFSLSASEMELCDLIVRGLDIGEIAALKKRDAAGIAHAVAALLSKLRCKNTTQLVRLVLALCPPTRPA
jgi:DNA-binding CsgD family transcriptional regulator